MEYYFCPQECKFLNITEEEQNKKSNIFIKHRCLKYNKVLYHLLAQPLLYRCEDCLKEN